jgi:hypothetical protein
VTWFPSPDGHLQALNGIQRQRRKQFKGNDMSRLLPITLIGLILSGLARAQAAPAQSVTSKPPAIELADDPLANDPPQPAETASAPALDPASLLPEPPSLPPSKATLVGGTVEKLDRVQDQLTVRVFGGDKVRILFDPRTRIYRDGAPASAADLRQGDRVYVDTVLDGSTVFARNIRVKTGAPVGESQGVIVSLRRDGAELTMRDALSPRSLKVRLSASTRIVQGDQSVPASRLVPGTLIAVKFGAQPDGRDLAREVSVLAVPGSNFTFAGQITALDLRTGLLVLTSTTDHKTYEIYLDPTLVPIDDSLRQGADVTVFTRFEGNRYVARIVTVNNRAQQ